MHGLVPTFRFVCESAGRKTKEKNVRCVGLEIPDTTDPEQNMIDTQDKLTSACGAGVEELQVRDDGGTPALLACPGWIVCTEPLDWGTGPEGGNITLLCCEEAICVAAEVIDSGISTPKGAAGV